MKRGRFATLVVGFLAALTGCGAQTAGPKPTVSDCGRIELDDGLRLAPACYD